MFLSLLQLCWFEFQYPMHHMCQLRQASQKHHNESPDYAYSPIQISLKRKKLFGLNDLGRPNIRPHYFPYLLIRVRADVHVVDCAPGQDLAETSLGRKYAMLARPSNHFSAAGTLAPVLLAAVSQSIWFAHCRLPEC
jgi:hypothetical protein